MKNRDLVNIGNTSRYATAFDCVSTLKLGGVITNVLHKNHKKMESAAEVYTSSRKSLQEQYSVKDEEGKMKIIEGTQQIDFGDNLEKFNEEFDKLVECEIETEKFDIEPRLAQLSDLTLQQTDALYFLLT